MLKKRIALFALCLVVSGLLFLVSWQGYRYHALSDRVVALEKEQKDLLEKNRAAIAEIAHEQSLRRIAEKAGDALEPLDPSHITRVTVGEGGR
jgi:ABC-type phosphate transport system auxiliary subunit